MYRSIIPTAVIIASLLFTAAGYAAQEYTVVTGVASDDVLNVRDAPNARANIVGRLPHDANRVAVSQCTSNGSPMTAAEWASQAASGDRTVSTWCSVEHASLPPKSVGWVNSRFLHPSGNGRTEVVMAASSTVASSADLGESARAESVTTSRQTPAPQASIPQEDTQNSVNTGRMTEFMNHAIPISGEIGDYDVDCCRSVQTRTQIYSDFPNSSPIIGYTIHSRHLVQILECKDDGGDLSDLTFSGQGRCLIRDSLSDEASAIGWVDMDRINAWNHNGTPEPFLIQTVEQFNELVEESRARREIAERRASAAQSTNEFRRSSSRYPRADTALLTQCFLSAYSNVLASPMGTAYSYDSGPEAGQQIYRSIVSGAANMRRGGPDERRRLNDNERAYYRQHVNTYRRRGTSIASRHREVIFVYNGAFSDFIDDLVRDCNAPP